MSALECGGAAHNSLVLVRGSGDIGSAVAHALFRMGCPVVIHDAPAPAVSRRKMAFTDALFDGAAQLDGIEAQRADGVDELAALLHARRVVPITSLDLPLILETLRPAALVDARMRKRQIPEDQRGLTPLTIGLGPNFIAGGNVDLAVETAYGEDLGRVVTQGPTRPLGGEPNPIGGHARDRYLYAPVSGTFRTGHEIGDPVERGQAIACIGRTPLCAPLSGVLRGLIRAGVDVVAGAKVIEVDPRGAAAQVSGIGARPGRIAQGVLQALRLRGIIPHGLWRSGMESRDEEIAT